MEVFRLPTHCLACGAYLMGGATEHKPGCGFQSLIDEFFDRVPKVPFKPDLASWPEAGADEIEEVRRRRPYLGLDDPAC